MNTEVLKQLNQNYRKILDEDVEGKKYTFDDFGYVCDKLDIPFVIYKKTINPFASDEEDRVKECNYKFENYKEFRKTMPNWSARNYDYERDCPTYYYHIKGIEDGLFDVMCSNSSCSYEWNFIVTDKVVIVYSTIQFID